ncbi:MAG: hypothetical protein AAFP19_20010, partial [Bacteroidota bacterium]
NRGDVKVVRDNFEKLPEQDESLIIKGGISGQLDQTRKLLVYTETGSVFDNRRVKIQIGERRWEWLMGINGEEITHWNFRKTFEVLGRSFEDVIVKKSTQFPNAYSELDVNAAVGIVAFRDENNELWVFDRFVE